MDFIWWLYYFCFGFFYLRRCNYIFIKLFIILISRKSFKWFKWNLLCEEWNIICTRRSTYCYAGNNLNLQSIQQCSDIYDLILLRNGWTTKDVELCFQPEPLLEILTISNLQYTMSNIWTCGEPEFKIRWTKLCCSDNYYTTAIEILMQLLRWFFVNSRKIGSFSKGNQNSWGSTSPSKNDES